MKAEMTSDKQSPATTKDLKNLTKFLNNPIQTLIETTPENDNKNKHNKKKNFTKTRTNPTQTTTTNLQRIQLSQLQALEQREASRDSTASERPTRQADQSPGKAYPA